MGNQKSRPIIKNLLTRGKRCRKKTDELGQKYTGILDRILEDARYCETAEKPEWAGTKCKELDDLAEEDHSCKTKEQELVRYRSNWRKQLNDSTFNGPTGSRAENKPQSHKIRCADNLTFKKKMDLFRSNMYGQIRHQSKDTTWRRTVANTNMAL